MAYLLLAERYIVWRNESFFFLGGFFFYMGCSGLMEAYNYRVSVREQYSCNKLRLLCN